MYIKWPERGFNIRNSGPSPASITYGGPEKASVINGALHWALCPSCSLIDVMGRWHLWVSGWFSLSTFWGTSKQDWSIRHSKHHTPGVFGPSVRDSWSKDMLAVNRRVSFSEECKCKSSELFSMPSIKRRSCWLGRNRWHCPCPLEFYSVLGNTCKMRLQG